MFAGFRLAAASAHESFGFEMRLVRAEVASAGPKPCEERRLAARECRVEAGESEAGRRGSDGAKLAASRGRRPKRRPGGLLRGLDSSPSRSTRSATPLPATGELDHERKRLAGVNVRPLGEPLCDKVDFVAGDLAVSPHS